MNNSMYLDSQPDYKIKNTETFDFQNDYAYSTNGQRPVSYKKYTFPFARENAVQLAYDNSPDLMVLISTRDAMEQALKYIRKPIFRLFLPAPVTAITTQIRFLTTVCRLE